MQQLINVHTALSIRQSFILLILCKGPQKKKQNISLKIEQNPKKPQTMMEEGGSGVEIDAMAIVALVALIQDNHHHRKGEGTSRFAIMDRQKTYTKAYRESGISGSQVSRVNECEPDNTEYVLPVVVSCRWFTTLRICFIYKSGYHKDFWLIASEFLQ